MRRGLHASQHLLKQYARSGYTIVEVMIVLAVTGALLLIAVAKPQPREEGRRAARIAQVDLDPLNLNDRVAVPMFGVFDPRADAAPYTPTAPSPTLSEADRARYGTLTRAAP